MTIHPELKKSFRKLMLENELGGSESEAYMLTLCPAGVSGYSFGLIQMDLSTGPDKIKVFRKALVGAGAPVSFIESIIPKVSKPGKTLTSDEIKKVNEYFTKAGAKAVIDDSFTAYYNDYVARITSAIKVIVGTDSKKSTFFDSLFAQLALMDYHNQFNMSPGGRMETYLKSESDVGPDTILKYAMSTKYAMQSDNQRRDLVRRFCNVIKASVGILPVEGIHAVGMQNIFVAYPATIKVKALLKFV